MQFEEVKHDTTKVLIQILSRFVFDLWANKWKEESFNGLYFFFQLTS